MFKKNLQNVCVCVCVYFKSIPHIKIYKSITIRLISNLIPIFVPFKRVKCKFFTSTSCGSVEYCKYITEVLKYLLNSI